MSPALLSNGAVMVLATGRSVLQRRPIRRCAGLRPIPSDGVLRQSSSARNSDCPDSLELVDRHFTVFIAFLAFLLNCGWYGDDVVCLNIQVFANAANSADANWGPLSVTRTSGMPYLANTALMTLHDVAAFSRATSM